MNPYTDIKFFRDKFLFCAFLAFGAFVQNDDA